MNVLLIPEDFRKDQYILKPLFTRLFRHLGATSAKIEVCLDPLLGGVDAALKPESMDNGDRQASYGRRLHPMRGPGRRSRTAIKT